VVLVNVKRVAHILLLHAWLGVRSRDMSWWRRRALGTGVLSFYSWCALGSLTVVHSRLSCLYGVGEHLRGAGVHIGAAEVTLHGLSGKASGLEAVGALLQGGSELEPLGV
jgi:hypothetical protein